MTDNNEIPTSCEEAQEGLTELALGILSGKERSDVLAHVGSCDRCTAELARLATLSDMLLELAPESEPPLGFELRLADRLQSGQVAHRSSRRRRIPVMAAAAALAVLVGFGGGALVNRDHSQSASPTTANLTAVGVGDKSHVLGEVVVASGKPGWVVMTLDADAWAGEVTCEVTFADGKVQKIGTYYVSMKAGVWRAPLIQPANTVRSAALVASNGLLIATATFPT